jgi:hypothetical protein
LKLASRYRNRVNDSEWFQHMADNPDRVLNIVKHIEDGTVDALTDELDRLAAGGLADFFDELGREAVALGILEPGQFKKRRGQYFAHFYDNAPEEFTEIWTQWTGKLATLSGKHNKSRSFGTIEDGVRISGLMNKVGTALRKAGVAVPITPELKPNVLIDDVVGRYINWYSNQKARRFFAEEMMDTLGIEVEEITQGKLALIFDGLEQATTDAKVLTKITERLRDDKLSPLRRRRVETEDVIEGADDADIAEVLADSGAGQLTEINEKSVLTPLDDAEKNFIRSLPKDGQREYLRRVLLSMRSQSQVVDFMAKYGDTFSDVIPVIRDEALPGQVEDALRVFGESAGQYTVRGGNSIWGKKPKMIPKLIADYIDEADPKILNSKEWPVLQKALDTIDWFNNWFKIGVYPLFPASAFRDGYSNVWFNSFRIGWHSLNPRLYAQSLKVLAHLDDAPGTVRAMNKLMTSLGYDPEHIVTRSGRRIRVADAAQEFRARNVIMSGEEGLEIQNIGGRNRFFVRKKGDKSVGGRIRGGVGKVVSEVRAPIDNTSRVALATQNLIDDLGFDDIGDEVGKYLFHYGELPQFSQEFIARAVPFARFSLKNIEFHFNMLKSNPGAVANRLKAFRGREDDRENMVKWKAESLQIALERDGRTLRVITGVDLPTRNLDLLYRGTLKRTLQMAAGMMSPLFKAPLEVTTETDLFTGRTGPRAPAETLGRFLDSTDAPKSLKDWLGYRKQVDEAGRPKYSVDRWNLGVVFLKSFMFSRVISTSDRQFREYANDEGVAAMLLDSLTGLRREDLNLDEQMERKLRTRVTQLERAAARRGAGVEFSRTFFPEEQEAELE